MKQRLSRVLSAARNGVRAAFRKLPSLLCDLAGFVGASLISYGGWLIYVPAGFVIGGLLLLTFAFLAGRKIETDKA